MSETGRNLFACDELGYVGYWLVTDVKAMPYLGEMKSEDQLRRDLPDATISPPSGEIGIGKPAPLGGVWHFYYPGRNIFVEKSGFYHKLSALDWLAATELVTDGERQIDCEFWACGVADLWVNGEHVIRHAVPKYMYPESTPLSLFLRDGVNRIAVRLQSLGTRDTRFLFGLRITEESEKIGIKLPGAKEHTSQLLTAVSWLDNVSLRESKFFISQTPPPVPATVKVGNAGIRWDSSTDRVSIEQTDSWQATVVIESVGERLERRFEMPRRRKLIFPAHASLSEHRRAILENLAKEEKNVRNVLAARTLGARSETQTELIEKTLDDIDGRPDCADFQLATILRMYRLGLLSQREMERTKETALKFRYWADEPGSDAMCFGSENHSLLFHGCQLIAGRLFPDATFVNSGRTGREQAQIGKIRCQRWLDQVEKNGFKEFLSSTYMPLTTGALLNLVDCSDDDELAARASRLVDEIFRMLAMHSFDGVTVGPQGRVYRGVLYPDSSGTQAMLSYATLNAVVTHNDWLSFVGSSKSYEIPGDIDGLLAQPVSKVYRQSNVEICLEKSANYLLTSLRIPTSWQLGTPKPAPPQSGRAIYPGMPGYQQHIWHATLGRDCHVFVNHPGATYDFSSSRPGFWYGNGTLPHTFQREDTIYQIYRIDDRHPVGFTHAHFPTDAFDEVRFDQHWAFGRKGSGYIALWCSEPLHLNSEVLADRELRAFGRRVAWIGRCAGSNEYDGFDQFVRDCLDTAPELNKGTLMLSAAGELVLVYTDKS